MKNAEHHELRLFELTDSLSLREFNHNTELVDTLLKNAEDGLAVRARVASGTYTGQTACNRNTYSDDKGVSFTQSLGYPRAGSVTLELDFEPLLVVISGSRSAAVNWSASFKRSDSDYLYDTTTLAGTEEQSYRLTLARGESAVRGNMYLHLPKIITDVSHNRSVGFGGFITNLSGYGIDEFRENDEDARVTFGTTAEGKHTVTIENCYGDMGGMEYRWFALGLGV